MNYQNHKLIKTAFLAFTILVVTGCNFSNSNSSSSGTSGSPTIVGDSVTLPKTDPMDPSRLHNWVKELTNFQPRWAGYPEELKATKWLAQRLSNAGLKTKIEPYKFRQWDLSSWEVNLIDSGQSEPIKSFPIWSSRGGAGSAELVDVGFGTELELLTKNISGKAVVVSGRALLNVFATYPETYHRAAELGAVAMFVTSDAPDNLIRPTSSGQNLLDDNPIPAFQLGAQDLAKLRESSRRGGTVSWKLDAKHIDGTTHDVVAHLPGSGQLKGTILICAHYDAWFSGALDNATGVSGLIGLAEYFAQLPLEKRPRDMIFLGVTGHDAGYPHGGVNNWVTKNKESIGDIELFMNLDHLAAHGTEHVTGTGIIDMLGIVLERPLDEERALFTTKHPALIRTFMPFVLKYTPLTLPLPTVPEITANGDLEGIMGKLGVPSVNLTMATPHYHTEEDTADRIPAKQLSRSVMAHRDFLNKILFMSREQIRSPI
ncbi:MAG: M28 family peptidase [Moraxellaceae bacterium]|nr:M28 family peptidase [Moraxellaceae bacterium]